MPLCRAGVVSARGGCEPGLGPAAGARAVSSPRAAASREALLLAIALVGMGAFLRAYNCWIPELGIDEYGTRWALAGVSWRETVSRVLHLHGQSPLYYLAVKLSCDLLGVSPISLRLPSLLSGIAVVALAYPLALKLFRQPSAAVMAVAVFALNERLIYYSQNARPYSLALLFTMLSFLAYAALLEKEAPAWGLAWVLSTAGAFYAHYLFGLIAVIQLLHLVSIRGASWLRSRTWPLAGVGLALLCLPSLPHLLSLFARRTALAWLPPAGPWVELQLVGRLLDIWSWLYIVPSVLLAGFSRAQVHALLDRRRGSLVLWWFLLPLLALSTLPQLFGVRLFSERYLLFALPAALLTTTWLMALVRPDTWRRWIPLAVVLIMHFAGWYLVRPYSRARTFALHLDQGWSRAVRALEREATSADVVVDRTGFVEADQLALSNPDPLLVSFIQSPVTANLSPGRSLTMIGLPRDLDDGVLRHAQLAAARRIWVIGLRPRAARATDVFLRDPSLEAVSTAAFGSVTLTLLERRS